MKVGRTATYQPYPRGTITIREGLKTLSTATLSASHYGIRSVSLPKLSRGTHYLRAYFRPTDAASRSSSSTSATIAVR
ncbi:MAG: hypothetical protein JWP31_902 [Aeromicrobium sp.]|nr:hypothetical protein [Aeromicrobium sp.]